MPDWTKSMSQTFEYYVVDPASWTDKERLMNVTASSITRDSEADTLGSASIDVVGIVEECYIRIYLVTIQNGIKERFCLGTFLVQTPSTTFDGKITTITLDAYTPLIELQENKPPLGYSILKSDNFKIMHQAYRLASEGMRAPVVEQADNTVLQSDFVANTDDTWLTYISDLAANAKYKLALDDTSRLIFEQSQNFASRNPVWTFTDDNSSILSADITVDRDLYGIPNVVEVTYSHETGYYFVRVENNDENSPTSIQSRGREIIYRTSPSLAGVSTEEQVKEYAESVLESVSTLEYTVAYTHGYVHEVALGSCVALNYTRAGLSNVKAIVTNQSIECTTGCSVSETAKYTVKLWSASAEKKGTGYLVDKNGTPIIDISGAYGLI